jgi:hypothetical protein
LVGTAVPHGALHVFDGGAGPLHPGGNGWQCLSWS